jgi:hypothetical protein
LLDRVAFGLSNRFATFAAQGLFDRTGAACCQVAVDLLPPFFRVLSPWGLTLPIDSLIGSALPLPVIPAQAHPFD